MKITISYVIAPKALIFGWANFHNVCLSVVRLSSVRLSSVCRTRQDKTHFLFVSRPFLGSKNSIFTTCWSRFEAYFSLFESVSFRADRFHIRIFIISHENFIQFYTTYEYNLKFVGLANRFLGSKKEQKKVHLWVGNVATTMPKMSVYFGEFCVGNAGVNLGWRGDIFPKRRSYS